MKRRIAMALVLSLLTIGLSGCSVFYKAEIHKDGKGMEYRECGLLGVPLDVAKKKQEPPFGLLPLYRETLLYEKD